MNTVALLIAAALASGTPLALAGLGLLVNEKAGVLNLGAEGMMLAGALAGFAAAYATGSDNAAFAAGALAGIALAALFAALVVGLDANPYASGLALTIFGAGLSAFIGSAFAGKTLTPRSPGGVPWLGELPFFGPALFRQHALVYASMLLAIGLAWFFERTRAGLVVRAVGESPEAAHALGLPVRRIRVGAVLAGGALCGVAGAYLSVVYAPLWVEGVTAGRGWIALALTPFATWKPARVLLGAWAFGGVTMLQFHLQGRGVQIPGPLLAMLPYLATIAMLVLISWKPAWIRGNIPASLGRPFHPAR